MGELCSSKAHFATMNDADLIEDRSDDKVVGNIVEGDVKPAHPFVCVGCGTSFPSVSGLRTHISSPEMNGCCVLIMQALLPPSQGEEAHHRHQEGFQESDPAMAASTQRDHHHHLRRNDGQDHRKEQEPEQEQMLNRVSSVSTGWNWNEEELCDHMER